jgi:hypothetical protein
MVFWRYLSPCRIVVGVDDCPINKTQTALRPHPEPLFVRLIRGFLIFLQRWVIFICKAIFLVVTGFRRLRIDRITVNQAFLLTNGLLMLHWQVRHALCIHVNGKWVGCRDNQVLLYPAKSTVGLDIRIWGLFSRYKNRFAIDPLATLAVGKVYIANSLVSGVSVRVLPVFFEDLYPPGLSATGRLVTNVAPLELIIPPFQTDNDYDKRLLHNAQVDLHHAPALEGSGGRQANP